MISESLEFLGMPVVDRVTQLSGVVTSVTFDLYGCVQAYVYTTAKDGKPSEGGWFDIKRLIVSGERVMDRPNFATMAFGTERGGNVLPAPR